MYKKCWLGTGNSRWVIVKWDSNHFHNNYSFSVAGNLLLMKRLKVRYSIRFILGSRQIRLDYTRGTRKNWHENYQYSKYIDSFEHRVDPEGNGLGKMSSFYVPTFTGVHRYLHRSTHVSTYVSTHLIIIKYLIFLRLRSEISEFQRIVFKY